MGVGHRGLGAGQGAGERVELLDLVEQLGETERADVSVACARGAAGADFVAGVLGAC